MEPDLINYLTQKIMITTEILQQIIELLEPTLVKI